MRMSTIRNFKIIERYSPAELAPGQTNQVKTLLSGAEAQQQLSGLTHVKEMRIDQFRPDGQTNLIARAPECLFDVADRTARSTGRLEVATADGRFLISGREGFTCWLTNFHVILSNRVRTEVRQTLVESARP